MLRESFVLHVAATRCWMSFEHKQMRSLKILDLGLNVLLDVFLDSINNLPTHLTINDSMQ